MAEEVVNTQVSVPEPVATPAPAPVVTTESAAPAPVEAAPQQTSPVVPSETQAPAAVVAEPAKPAEVAPTTTLLGEAPKPLQDTTEKPVEAKVEEKQSDEPAPLPSYEPWVLPEHVKQEDEKVTQFTGILAEYEKLSKADHAETQKLGQQLLDYHIAEQTKTVELLTKQIQEGWAKQRNEWREATLNDPVIGGDNWAKTLQSANEFINTHGGTPEQQTEFRELMNTSGLGNHPVVLRMLAQANKNMGEGKPLPAQAPPPAPKSKVQAFYGGGGR